MTGYLKTHGRDIHCGHMSKGNQASLSPIIYRFSRCNGFFYYVGILATLILKLFFPQCILENSEVHDIAWHISSD